MSLVVGICVCVCVRVQSLAPVGLLCLTCGSPIYYLPLRI